MAKIKTLTEQRNPLSLDAQLCFASYATSHAFTKAYKPHLDRLGLTYPQYLVMLVLWETDNLSVKAIGERLHLDSGTLTPLLKRLETAGRLTRTRDAADERLVRISLTAAGRALREEAVGIPGKLICSPSITPEKAKAVRDGLAEIRQALAESEAAASGD